MIEVDTDMRLEENLFIQIGVEESRGMAEDKSALDGLNLAPQLGLILNVKENSFPSVFLLDLKCCHFWSLFKEIHYLLNSEETAGRPQKFHL